MRHDCVLAPQLESLSEGNYGAGAEESDTDEETRIAVIADIARHRRNRKGKTLPLIYADDTDRKNQDL